MYRSMQTLQGIRLGEEQGSELSLVDTLLMDSVALSDAEGKNSTLHPFLSAESLLRECPCERQKYSLN